MRGLPSEAGQPARKMRTPPASENEPYSFSSVEEMDADNGNNQITTTNIQIKSPSAHTSQAQSILESEHIAQDNARAHIFAHVNVNSIEVNEYNDIPSHNSVHSANNTYKTQADGDLSRSLRIRQYNTKSKGPFIVFIRELATKLAPIKLTKYITHYYPSTTIIKRSPGSLKVSLTCVSQANAMVSDTFFAEYHVSVPADHVEVDGAIDWHDLCDIKDMNELCSIGKGVFNNTSIPNCNIVHAERLSRLDSSVGGRNLIETNTIKLTFDGNLLPNHIHIMGLRVRVRPFFKKPMFCDKCQTFGHTVKFCRSKVRCASCAAEHPTKECPFDNSRCPYCQQIDKHDRYRCPFFSEVNESFKLKQAERRKAMLKQAAVKATSDAVDPSNNLQSTNDFPVLRNRFDILPEDDTYDDDHIADATQHIPKNPYAKIVKQGITSSTLLRAGLKRSRPTSTSKLVNDSTPPKSHSLDRLPTASKNKPISNPPVDTNPSSVLSEAIVKFARSAGVSNVWITLLQAIIEPLLRAVMPKLNSILGNLAQDVLNNSR